MIKQVDVSRTLTSGKDSAYIKALRKSPPRVNSQFTRSDLVGKEAHFDSFVTSDGSVGLW